MARCRRSSARTDGTRDAREFCAADLEVSVDALVRFQPGYKIPEFLRTALNAADSRCYEAEDKTDIQVDNLAPREIEPEPVSTVPPVARTPREIADELLQLLGLER